MALTDLRAKIIRSLLVVCMRRQKQAKKPDNAFLPQRNRLRKIAVAVASSVHEHKPDRRIWTAFLDSLAQSANSIGHKLAWIAVDAVQTQLVSQT